MIVIHPISGAIIVSGDGQALRSENGGDTWELIEGVIQGSLPDGAIERAPFRGPGEPRTLSVRLAFSVQAARRFPGWQPRSSPIRLIGARSTRSSKTANSSRFAPTPRSDPSPLLGNIPGSVRHRTRRRPADGARAAGSSTAPADRPPRGTTRSCRSAGKRRLDLLAAELARVLASTAPRRSTAARTAGPAPGGFTTRRASCTASSTASAATSPRVNTYSIARRRGASSPRRRATSRNPGRDVTPGRAIVENTELFVAFGGIPLKNVTVNAGGVSRHRTRGYLRAAAAHGVEFVLFSPLRDDLAGS